MNNTVKATRGRQPRKSMFSPISEMLDDDTDDILEAIDARDSGPSRPAPRPVAAHSESPRERATRRAAEVRGNIGSMDEGTDDFYIDPSVIPDGWSYEWKMHTVFGKEDPSYSIALARKGWEPVETSRHPEMMATGNTEKLITRKGMILMERPMELTEEAKRIEQRRARLQVKTKEEQLSTAKSGEFERNNKDSSLAKIKKGWEAMPIPD